MVRLFSTQFPINPDANLEDLLEIGKRWVLGSPHYQIPRKEIESLLEHGDSYESENLSFSLRRAKTDEYSTIGFRHQSFDRAGNLWTLKTVGTKTENYFLASVIVDYDTKKPTPRIPSSKKPHIIKLILEGLGGGRDGDIMVSSEPVYLKEGDESFIADILGGYSETTMPVTYVSVDNRNEPHLNPHKLAIKLSGISHVLMEPSRDFSFKMKEQTRGKNVYGGGVGVYWDGGKGFLWIPESIEGLGIYPESQISEKIIEALKSRRISNDLTWINIQSIHNMQILRRLRESHKDLEKSHESDLEEVFRTYDSELSTKKERIEELESQIPVLEARLRSTAYDSDGILPNPQIVQIYQQEVRTILHEVLTKAGNNVEKGTRRKMVLDRLVDSIKPSSEKQKAIEKLKALFRNYSRLTHQMRSELQKMGFVIDENGKHYQLRLSQEPNLSVTFPKTPSDYRSGKNIVRDITKTFF